MVSTAAKPLLLSLLLLLFVISAVQCYQRHPISRLPDRRTGQVSHHYRQLRQRGVARHRSLLEKNATRHPHPGANSSSNSNSTTNSTSNGTAPAQEEHRRHGRKHHVRNCVIGFVVGALAGLGSGLLMTVLFRLALNCIRGRYRSRSGVQIFSPKLIKSTDCLAFLEKEDSLSALVVIGRGGCGEVYKAQLPVEKEGEEPKFIAIKKIKKQSAEGNNAANLSDQESGQLDKWMRQVRSEIRTVGHIRHRNLLPLAAHVPRPDCHYLIYEFMRNGSLRDALREASEGRSELPWLARHRIAVGIASGLEYLHVSQRPQIIHRDLKPANILLDDDMEARIADFGLAKAMPDANTHMTASNLAGTVGYIAPEYHQTLKFTSRCDIYSFGVILAVLVTGKEPSDPFFQEIDEVGLVKWMRAVLASDNPGVAIDSSIAGSGFDEQVRLVLRIACFCTADDPKQRPSAKDVRCMLLQIKH